MNNFNIKSKNLIQNNKIFRKDRYHFNNQKKKKQKKMILIIVDNLIYNKNIKYKENLRRNQN